MTTGICRCLHTLPDATEQTALHAAQKICDAYGLEAASVQTAGCLAMCASFGKQSWAL